MYFPYSQTEINHLKSRDKVLSKVIDQIGVIQREVNPDLYSALVHAIVGQQISTKAHRTIWQRMQNELGEISPENLNGFSMEDIQKTGISFRKAEYIKSTTTKIINKALDLKALYDLSDDEVRTKLTELRGIGNWTAEMLMIFSMQRPNILSFGDLAIQKAMRRLYGHEKIDKQLFQYYWEMYSPYASVASLYLWASNYLPTINL